MMYLGRIYLVSVSDHALRNNIIKRATFWATLAIKKSFEINSKLFWCGKQDLNLHTLASSST